MLNSTVVGRADVTSDLIILQVKPDGGIPDFLPGQYVALGLPGSAPRFAGAQPEREPATQDKDRDKLIKRAYSISSSPRQKGYLEFYVAVVPDGALTSRLAALQPGDRVFSQPKVTGTFTLDSVPNERNLLLVSTGTGLAPFMSMLRTDSTWAGSRRITVVHGVRFPSDFAYSDELESYRERGSRFEYLPISSRAGDEFAGRRGRIQKLFESEELVPNAEHDSVFLCGNPAMVEDVERYLLDRGFAVHSKKSPGNLHVEKYW